MRSFILLKIRSVDSIHPEPFGTLGTGLSKAMDYQSSAFMVRQAHHERNDRLVDRAAKY